MNNIKEIGEKQSANQLKGYSKEYDLIRREAETKWPAWKVSTYNANFATSAHAKKIGSK